MACHFNVRVCILCMYMCLYLFIIPNWVDMFLLWYAQEVSVWLTNPKSLKLPSYQHRDRICDQAFCGAAWISLHFQCKRWAHLIMKPSCGLFDSGCGNMLQLVCCGLACWANSLNYMWGCIPPQWIMVKRVLSKMCEGEFYLSVNLCGLDGTWVWVDVFVIVEKEQWCHPWKCFCEICPNVLSYLP